MKYFIKYLNTLAGVFVPTLKIIHLFICRPTVGLLKVERDDVRTTLSLPEFKCLLFLWHLVIKDWT